MKRAFCLVPLLVGATACSLVDGGSPAGDQPPTAPALAGGQSADPPAAGGAAPAAWSANQLSAPENVFGAPRLDLVAVRADGSMIRVFGGEQTDLLGGRPRLLSHDESTVVQSWPFGEATRVVWRDVFSGKDLAGVEIDAAELSPSAIDADGSLVALVNAAEPASPDTIAGGRRSTTIVVADSEKGERRRFRLAGNFVPEAFSTSTVRSGLPNAIFVLEYRPARAPTHYRVRVLDTTTGRLGLPVSLRDKATPVDASMAGISRIQVVAAHGDGLLFTLYRGVAGEDGRHGYAFVHTLGLFGGVWCLDTARQLDLDTEAGTLVVAGDHLVVASANGSVGNYDIDAVVDPQGDPSMRAVQSYKHDSDGRAPAVAALGDRVWVAWGHFVYQLDAETLEMTTASPFRSDEPVTAMAATANGVLLAHPGGRVTIASGATLQLPAGLTGVADDAVVRLLVR